ncbi:MAG: exodeoxyribonuclease V subunit alpha [Opitutales bacterium]|jgi:exodeoxyribonuclease V alpha subunit
MKQENTAMPALAGHAATMLCSLAGTQDELLRKAVTQLLEVLEGGGTCITLDELGEAIDVSARLGALSVVGQPGQERPLIIDGPRLYLHRYHGYETRLAAQLLRLAAAPAQVPDAARGDARRLLSQGLGVVTGGPGTGKTTFAATLLELLAGGTARPLSAALMAPTGKAAARLLESISVMADRFPNLQISHGTVHRMLGPRPGSVFFRHGAARPLPFDVAVLDEASMMDLPLMAKLLDAIDPERTRLLMLGDPGQLPSIHSGCALADIVDAAQRPGPMATCFLRLTKNHRAAERPELAALIDSVREGDARRCLALIREGGCIAMSNPPPPDQMPDFVEREILPGIEKLCAAQSPEEALDAASDYRLVCMLRQGPCGADAVNRLALELARRRRYCGRDERFFHGMPIIVTRNEHKMNLFNGDSGVVLREDGRLRAFFPGVDKPRGVSIQNLPPVEAAFALTVHRGQGSEYRNVGILLPGADHPMLTRELFYTAVSRARNSIAIMGTADLISRALSRQEKRASGLAARLVSRNNDILALNRCRSSR